MILEWLIIIEDQSKYYEIQVQYFENQVYDREKQIDELIAITKLRMILKIQVCIDFFGICELMSIMPLQ